MGKYQTEQKKLLLAFLKAHSDRQFSAEELAQIFESEEGAPAMGKSTVYRLVVQMTEEGMLRRFPKTEGRGWLYQYHQAHDCKGHLHLKCTGCGALLHLKCGMGSELLSHIENTHQFKVDNTASVLYGLCASCRKTQEERGSTST